MPTKKTTPKKKKDNEPKLIGPVEAICFDTLLNLWPFRNRWRTSQDQMKPVFDNEQSITVVARVGLNSDEKLHIELEPVAANIYRGESGEHYCFGTEKVQFAGGIRSQDAIMIYTVSKVHKTIRTSENTDD